MENKFAFHILKQLVIKAGQQRHAEALETLYADFKKQERLAQGYTVVGIYGDNDQPWMAIVDKAESPQDAAKKAIGITYNKGENGVEKEDIFVIEVFAGRSVKGILGNDKVLSLKDLLKAKARRMAPPSPCGLFSFIR